MSVQLSAIHFFIGAIALLLSNALVQLLSARGRVMAQLRKWRAAERTIAVLALLSAVFGLVFSAISRASLPVIAREEVITGSAVGAMLWRLLFRHRCEPRLRALFFYVMVAGLLMWGVAHPGSPQVDSGADSVQQTFMLLSYFALALACGAFVNAGSLALSCLVVGGREEKPARVGSNEEAGRTAVIPGLPLLTLSLLFGGLAGQHAEGVYWSWTASESWQLLVWLYYAALWCTFVLLGWRSRRLSVLAGLGVMLTGLMLEAMLG